MKLFIKYHYCSVLAIISIVFGVSCTTTPSKPTETYGYTREQIESLKTKDSKILSVDRSNITKIDLNDLFDGAIKFTEIITKANIIELESSEESLVGGNIQKVIITDSRIYIEDDFLQGGVIIFDRNGKYIHRIKNGNGPGELFQVASIDFDYNTNELVVCQNRSMYYYDKDGNYLRDKPTPFGTYDFKIYNGQYAFETINPINPQMQEIANNMFFMTDTNFRVVKSGLPDATFIAYASRHYLSENEGDLFIEKNFNDTIYALNGNNLSARYVLDYSSKKIPQNIIEKSNSFTSFRENTNGADYTFFLGDYLEAGNIQVFRLTNLSKGDFLAFRNKKTGKIVGGYNKRFDIEQLPFIDLPISNYKDYFITTITKYQYSEYCKNSTLLSKEDIAKILRHKEDDNQLLVLFKVEL